MRGAQEWPKCVLPCMLRRMDEQQQAQASTERTQERVAGTDDVAQRGHRRWLTWLRWSAVALLSAVLLLDLAFPLPLPKSRDTSTLVVARDGTPLRAFADAQGVWRYPATPQSVSPLYLQALLNYEDRWFWHHPGVNPWGLLRAGEQWIGSGRIVSGGSTLTMQVARILDPHTRTPWGKAKQLLRALQWKRTSASSRSWRCIWSARRTAAPSRAWKRPAGPTWASRPPRCRRPKRRCWRCCRSRRAGCARIATRKRRNGRATKCSTAWWNWACGRAHRWTMPASNRW